MGSEKRRIRQYKAGDDRMKKASEKLNQLLLNTQVFYMTDLYTITLTNGVILRYTSGDITLKVGASVYQPFLIERTGTTQERGISVDEVNLTITTDQNDAIPGGLTFMQGVVNGAFEGALLQIDRAFSPEPFRFNMPAISEDYILLWWIGILNIDSAGGNTIEATASSMTQLLNVKFPRNLYYPPCIYTLGDVGCKVDTNRFKVTGAAAAGSTRSHIKSKLALANGYLTQGSITFVSGKNTNVTRSIRTNAGGDIHVVLPFMDAPEAGDAFYVLPACDKSMNCCKYRFNNLQNFRGYPFIPVPETAY